MVTPRLAENDQIINIHQNNIAPRIYQICLSSFSEMLVVHFFFQSHWQHWSFKQPLQGVVNAVFSTSSSATGICQYPLAKSNNVGKKTLPLQVSPKSHRFLELEKHLVQSPHSIFCNQLSTSLVPSFFFYQHHWSCPF